MTGYMPLWMNPDWDFFPELEIVEWPRLARWREEHAQALAALQAARKKADRDATTHRMLDVMEAATVDLAEHFEDEAEAAFKEMRATIGPVPERRDKRAAIAPKLAAGARDRDRLQRVSRAIKAEALTEAGLEPVILAEVAELRAELPRPKAPEPEAAPEPEVEEATEPEAEPAAGEPETAEEPAAA